MTHTTGKVLEKCVSYVAAPLACEQRLPIARGGQEQPPKHGERPRSRVSFLLNWSKIIAQPTRSLG